ncbi:MAG: protein-disulfide reductase DsbD domain-containing protein [Acidobacteriota bacterium]
MSFSFVRTATLALLLVALTGAARAEIPSRARNEQVALELVTDQAAVAPGATLQVGIHFVLEKDWHLYWENPGDSGMEPKIRFRLPRGARLQPMTWPAPQRLPLKHLVSFGYEKDLLLYREVTLPPSLEPGTTIELKAEVSWLACKVECIPGDAELSLTLPVESAARPATSERRALFTRWQGRHAVAPADAELTVTAGTEPGFLRLVVEGDDTRLPDTLTFFPKTQQVIANAGTQQLASENGRRQLRVPLAQDGIPVPQRLRGMLTTRADDDPTTTGPAALSVDLNLGDQLPPWPALATTTDAETPGFLLAIVSAFLGGLLLNLMPCVLPVLSLKVLGFARAGTNGKERLQEALGFTLGVLLGFWLVAAALLVLRGVGESLGWGFQLQSPAFVAGSTIAFTLLAVNLFGLFEIPGVAWTGSSGGRFSAIVAGLVAVLVATPCTAPFMGPAVAVALTGGAVLAVAVFTALGLGMATPQLLVAALPKVAAWLPRPGEWMVTFKQLLGFPMLLTAAWLASVFADLPGTDGTPRGVDGMTRLLLGCVIAALGAYLLGWLAQDARRSSTLRWTGRIAAVASLVAALALPLREPPSGLPWQPYEATLLTDLETEGRPYFLDVTASWCLSCQVNESVALDTPAVVELFAAHDITPVKADWTSRDDAITALLASHGRASVPLYVFHPGAGENVDVLPSVLTEGLVVDRVTAGLN